MGQLSIGEVLGALAVVLLVGFAVAKVRRFRLQLRRIFGILGSRDARLVSTLETMVAQGELQATTV